MPAVYTGGVEDTYEFGRGRTIVVRTRGFVSSLLYDRY